MQGGPQLGYFSLLKKSLFVTKYFDVTPVLPSMAYPLHFEKYPFDILS